MTQQPTVVLREHIVHYLLCIGRLARAFKKNTSAVELIVLALQFNGRQPDLLAEGTRGSGYISVSSIRGKRRRKRMKNASGVNAWEENGACVVSNVCERRPTCLGWTRTRWKALNVHPRRRPRLPVMRQDSSMAHKSFTQHLLHFKHERNPPYPKN